ncbi:MAG: hypothetical protein H6737_04555 [Alphaproteobacteria bacterium]|nr:hypothetical protein [Alphaproteobacteria bacterium]
MSGSPVPEALEGRVRFDGDAIVLRDTAWRPYPVLAVGLLVASVAAAFACISALVGFFGLLGHSASVSGVGLAGLLGFVLAAVAAVALPTVHTVMAVPLRIDDLGVWLQHPFGKAVRKPLEVQVYGAVGTRITVRIVGEDGTFTPIETLPSVSGHGWTLDALLWFADAMAARVGVPVQSTIDRAAWARWELDPQYRRRVRFDLENAANRRRYGRQLDVEPVEPRDLRYDHHGMRVGNDLLVEAGEVRVPGRRLALRSIVDAVAQIYEVHVDDGIQRRVRLQLLTTEGIFRVRARRLSGRDVRETLWIANELKRLASETPPEPDAGTASDVPAALRRMRTAE